MRGLSAVLFDMDGTLLDSEKLWTIGLDELARHLGGRISPAAREAMVGTSTTRTMVVLHADLGLPDDGVADSARWLDKRVAELFETGLRWRPGARELLAEVRAAGLPAALVTATPRSLVEVALGFLGRDSFAAVVAGDEVRHVKPHPEPYRTAARLVGADPRDCVAIEDSPTGLASAHAAGCAVLAVPSEIPLEPSDSYTLVPSLAGIDLTFLRRLTQTTPPASSPN